VVGASEWAQGPIRRTDATHRPLLPAIRGREGGSEALMAGSGHANTRKEGFKISTSKLVKGRQRRPRRKMLMGATTNRWRYTACYSGVG
jgi:hypothetical protein